MSLAKGRVVDPRGREDWIRAPRVGEHATMSPWDLLFVPGALLFISALLAGMSWFEQRVLSPRALILHSARSRHAPPEHVESLVAAHAEKLLEGRLNRPTDPDHRS